MPSVIDDLPPPTSMQDLNSGINDLPPPPAPKLQAPGLSGIIQGYKNNGLNGAWDAMKANKAAYDQEMADNPPVAGYPPLVVPAGALGAFGKAMVALGSGEGLGYAAGRTALSAGQGAVSSALNGKEGESTQDKLNNAASGGALTGGIQLAAESIPVVGKALGWGAKKIGHALTGEIDSLIENYAKRTDEVNRLVKENGGDMTAAADQVRTELSQGIQKTKNTLRGQISQSLAGAPTEKNIDLDPILSHLENQRTALMKNNQVEEANQVGSIIEKIKGFGVDKDPTYGVSQYTGKTNAQGLNSIKGLLQDIATPAYQQNGQIFNYAKSSQQAAKSGGAIARKMLNAAVPEVAQANNQLSAMHSIEDNLNRNLLAPGKSDTALFAAGSGANPRNEKMLEQLGSIAGVDALGRAKDLATARAFANAPLVPKDFNGKALARIALGAGIGGAAKGRDGAVAGAVLSSPATLKGVINTANMVRKAGVAAGLPQIAQAIGQNPYAAQNVAQLFASQMGNANKVSPQIQQSGDGQSPPMLLQNGGGNNRAPAKGPDSWAQRGLNNLGIQDQDLQKRLLSDPKAKQLLIQASDLPSNSKALKRIQAQLTKGYGIQ